MEPGEIIKWAIILGVAVMIFATVSGLDDLLSKWLRGAPTKQDLQARVDALEARVKALEERG